MDNNVYRCYNCGRFMGRNMLNSVSSKITGLCKQCNRTRHYVEYKTSERFRKNTRTRNKNRYNKINKITQNKKYKIIEVKVDEAILKETLKMTIKYNNIKRLSRDGLIRTLILEHNMRLKDWIENNS